MSGNLAKLLLARDKSFKVLDYLRFKGSDGPFDEMEEIHDILSAMVWEALSDDNYSLITAIEDFVIKPGETKSIKTNLDNMPIFSIEENKQLTFTNEGIISTHGFLSFDLVRNYENGNRIFITNNVPKEAEEKHDLCGYHYCDPKTTQYFGPGIYRIEKGTVIGIATVNKNLDYVPSKVKEKI